jgi:hypothetical protein
MLTVFFCVMTVLYCVENPVSRADLGLHKDWDIVEDWLGNSKDIPKSVPLPRPEFVLKNVEVPILTNFDCCLGPEFWKIFPSNYPSEMRTGGVDVGKLKILVDLCKDSWTASEKYKARKTIDSLSGKRPVKLLRDLPSLKEKNAKSALENGAAMTDVLATWLKKGFVVGPFDSLPCEGFRSNPLMAAVQRFKGALMIRPPTKRPRDTSTQAQFAHGPPPGSATWLRQ